MDDAGSDDGRDRRRVHVGDSDFLARKPPGKSLESPVVTVFVALHSLAPLGASDVDAQPRLSSGVGCSALLGGNTVMFLCSRPAPRPTAIQRQ